MSADNCTADFEGAYTLGLEEIATGLHQRLTDPLNKLLN